MKIEQIVSPLLQFAESMTAHKTDMGSRSAYADDAETAIDEYKELLATASISSEDWKAGALAGAEAAIRENERVVCWTCSKKAWIGPNPDCEECNQRVQAIRQEASNIVSHLTPVTSSPDLETKVKDLKNMLTELHAMVWGECPSLLNEDSGGAGELDIRIKNALSMS